MKLAFAESQLLILKWVMISLERLQQPASSEGQGREYSVGRVEKLGEEEGELVVVVNYQKDGLVCTLP